MQNAECCILVRSMRTHLIAILILSCLLSLSSAVDAQPPYIVLILADDLGYGDLACYGNEFHETPSNLGDAFTTFATKWLNIIAWGEPTEPSASIGVTPGWKT
jgi:arylsulfatase A